MRSLMTKLLPYTTYGLALRIDADTIYANGFCEDVNLEDLTQEVANNWLEIARQEALLLVRDGKIEKTEQLQPIDLNHLLAKLQLGRQLKPDEQQRLNAYYDAIDAIEAEERSLNAAIANASVADLNSMQWPEWVQWTRIPEHPTFVFSID